MVDCTSPVQIGVGGLDLLLVFFHMLLITMSIHDSANHQNHKSATTQCLLHQSIFLDSIQLAMQLDTDHVRIHSITAAAGCVLNAHTLAALSELSSIVLNCPKS